MMTKDLGEKKTTVKGSQEVGESDWEQITNWKGLGECK